MKCRVPRLKSCCCCVNLRAGCFFLALLEIAASVLGFFVAEEGRLFLIGRLGYLFHFIGSIFLLMSSMLIEVLTIIYLGTNIFHLIFSTAFVIEYALHCKFCALETTPVYITLKSSFQLSVSILGWWPSRTCGAFSGRTIQNTTTDRRQWHLSGYLWGLFWIYIDSHRKLLRRLCLPWSVYFPVLALISH
ncbi:uncharacterized protein LOC6498983 isoform X2 [Drosophila ananassae]|uniref:uncharacterized protein LOC6498983 isoform X2 n=1 Tax=Drosophila ananassae TaxID=7217 RepID=UPI001CFFF1E0|nr:uncharacterized protein LOC6498983 isoform X2 [Drosophila ananassae]